MEMSVDETVRNEDFLVQNAKETLEKDPLTAKAWMLTAKTLYPDNFAVQFEAYNIEKNTGNIKEAAKSFSDLLNKFQQHPELWKEIEKVTTALRTENEDMDAEKIFLCNLFKQIPLSVQHQLLLVTADQCEDTMEHCRLLMLLMKKFPKAVSSHGPRLVDTLMTAEKHSHANNQPMNSFRRLLVCDLLPMLKDTGMELSPKLLYRLLHKSIEFYLCYLMNPTALPQDPESRIAKPWCKLFEIVEVIGKHLNWDPYLSSFNNPGWVKETFWQTVMSFCQSHKLGEDPASTKQLLYCVTVFLLYCLHEYTGLVYSDSTTRTHPNVLLVEAFTDPSLQYSSEPKSKRRKLDLDIAQPTLTADSSNSTQLLSFFSMAVNCWDLLHSTDSLQREFTKLSNHLKLDPLLHAFISDHAMYKGRYEDVLMRLHPNAEAAASLPTNIRFACINYFKQNYSVCFDYLLQITSSITSTSPGQFSNNLVIGGTQRHLHFLNLNDASVLQYCIKILIYSIKESISKQPGNHSSTSIGNLLVLIQYDWPRHEEMLPFLMDLIRQKHTFQYILFSEYIINVDILEQIKLINFERSGNTVLDIFPTPQNQMGQRRIGTRGADKGVREDFKQAMRRQVARCCEPIDKLIIKFLTQEHMHILQSLIN